MENGFVLEIGYIITVIKDSDPSKMALMLCELVERLYSRLKDVADELRSMTESRDYYCQKAGDSADLDYYKSRVEDLLNEVKRQESMSNSRFALLCKPDIAVSILGADNYSKCSELMQKSEEYPYSRKIDAIKLVREVTQFGLKDAKDFVETVWKQ